MFLIFMFSYKVLNMTQVYFVRHARSLYSEDDRNRPLSEKGKNDAKLVSEYFDQIHIDRVVSSPDKRAIATIQEVADSHKLEIEIFEELHERRITNGLVENFKKFTLNQWKDFNYKLAGGESLNEVKARSLKTFEKIIEESLDQVVVIGTHGTILSLYLNHLEEKFQYHDFKKMKLPDIYKVNYDGSRYVSMERINIYK